MSLSSIRYFLSAFMSVQCGIYGQLTLFYIMFALLSLISMPRMDPAIRRF